MISISITVQQQRLQRYIHRGEVRYIADLHTKPQRLMYIHSTKNHTITSLLPQRIPIIIITTSAVMMPTANNTSSQIGIVLIHTIQDEALLELNFGYD